MDTYKTIKRIDNLFLDKTKTYTYTLDVDSVSTMTIVSQTVTAKPRKLSGNWTLETPEEMKAQYGFDQDDTNNSWTV